MPNSIPALYVSLVVAISAFLAIVALVVSAVTTLHLRRRYKKAEWIPVPVTVEHSEIVKNGRVFTPSIRYSYSFDGLQYTSSIISPDLHYASSNDKTDPQKWVTLFPVGTKVTAYLDKANPSVAVLFPDFRYGWWYIFLVAFAVFGGSNFILLVIPLIRP
ncbi:DUF3592 domain-containing protein [Rhodoferax sp.]|uniref:DUF3592 domain-containing protein n=1 Tax=Rhodoferax sp. TaxID=50421 RepID=UPI002ACE304A|nr:DUF3592 domain-containing protein [Rhodoferax sp.]MDZ7918837.1 DUF3592 domain-containing protein [Rhodoferax sp.]